MLSLCTKMACFHVKFVNFYLLNLSNLNASHIRDTTGGGGIVGIHGGCVLYTGAAYTVYHFHFCRQADCFVRMLHIYITEHSILAPTFTIIRLLMLSDTHHSTSYPSRSSNIGSLRITYQRHINCLILISSSA